MAANTIPIFTRLGKIGMGCQLKAAANDYTGGTMNTKEVFGGDDTNGAFIERLRFKAVGTNVQTVARIYFNDGGINTVWGSAPTHNSPSTATTGGTIPRSTTYYARIVAIGPGGARSPVSTEQSQATGAGTDTNTITWNWTAVVNATKYEVFVSDVAAATSPQVRMFEVTGANTLVQANIWQTGSNRDSAVGNMQLYGEITLPATTASATLATPDIDYPMNFALEPGVEVYVGLGTAVSAGWNVCAIGGIY